MIINENQLMADRIDKKVKYIHTVFMLNKMLRVHCRILLGPFCGLHVVLQRQLHNRAMHAHHVIKAGQCLSSELELKPL